MTAWPRANLAILVTGDAETRSEFESMACVNGFLLSSLHSLPGILNGTGYQIDVRDVDAAGMSLGWSGL